MLTRKLFTEALREDFDYSNNQLGKRLANEKSVLSLTISKNDIEATVLDRGRSYYVNFEYEEEDTFYNFEGECTCDEYGCQHQAAVLYTAIDLKKSNPSKTRKKKATNTSQQKTAPPTNVLKGKHAGEYRHLPTSLGLDFAIR